VNKNQVIKVKDHPATWIEIPEDADPVLAIERWKAKHEMENKSPVDFMSTGINKKKILKNSKYGTV